MKALLIAPGPMIGQIISGEKKNTIRKGYRDFVAGEPVLIGCHIANWCVMADIVKVRHCKLKEITLSEVWNEGFSNHNHLYECLLIFYPDLTWDDEVTSIRWDNVRGGMIDGTV